MILDVLWIICSPVSKSAFFLCQESSSRTDFPGILLLLSTVNLTNPLCHVPPQVEREMMRENYRTEDNINDVRCMLQLMLESRCCSSATELINCVRIEYLGTL